MRDTLHLAQNWRKNRPTKGRNSQVFSHFAQKHSRTLVHPLSKYNSSPTATSSNFSTTSHSVLGDFFSEAYMFSRTEYVEKGKPSAMFCLASFSVTIAQSTPEHRALRHKRNQRFLSTEYSRTASILFIIRTTSRASEQQAETHGTSSPAAK